jgi:hypothetical protein
MAVEVVTLILLSCAVSAIILGFPGMIVGIHFNFFNVLLTLQFATDWNICIMLAISVIFHLNMTASLQEWMISRL